MLQARKGAMGEYLRPLPQCVRSTSQRQEGRSESKNALSRSGYSLYIVLHHHASGAGCAYVNAFSSWHPVSRRTRLHSSRTSTYPPRIADFKPSRRLDIIRLSSQEAREPPISVHHCTSCQYVFHCPNPYEVVGFFFSFILCLSHWSTECLALLPPFCMCLILERAAPEKPNMPMQMA